jgi:hypothetical protein
MSEHRAEGEVLAMADPKVRSAASAVEAIVLFSVGFRCFSLVVLAWIGVSVDPMFFDFDDIFADALKFALAQTAVTDPILQDPQVANWPETFQEYVNNNAHMLPNAAMRFLPPFGMLLFMGIAGLFFWMSPVKIIGFLTAIYSAVSAVLARAYSRFAEQPLFRPAITLMLLSFPALFMFNRGNFHAGFTGLCAIGYMLSTRYSAGWPRWLGWVALALAINIRPNIAILALLECRPDRTIRETAAAIAKPAVLSIALASASLAIVHAIDPLYTIETFLHDYGIYSSRFVEGTAGLVWNLSLANVAKLAHALVDGHAAYNPTVAALIWMLGAVMTAIFVTLRRGGRISGSIFAFAITAIYATFTPVFAQYHAIVFVGPLLLLLIDAGPKMESRLLWRGAIALAAIQLICLLNVALPFAQSLIIPAFLPAVFAYVVAKLVGTQEHGEAYVAVLACAVALAPLGGQIYNGLAIALAQISTLLWLAWRQVSLGPHLVASQHGRSSQ